MGPRMGGPRPADRAGLMSRFNAEPIPGALEGLPARDGRARHRSSLPERAAEPALPRRRRDRPRQEPGRAWRYRPGHRAAAGRRQRGPHRRCLRLLQSDIADQNLKRLNVTGHDHLPFASRLTMLAKHSRRLAAASRNRHERQAGQPRVLHPRDVLRDGLADGQGGGTGDAAPPPRLGTRPARAGGEVQPHAAAGLACKS